MTQEERKRAYEIIIKAYGSKAQMELAIEEMAELTKEIIKYFRSSNKGACFDFNNLYQEIADVSAMIEQLIYIFDCDENVKKIMEDKIKRTLDKIKESKKKARGD